MDPDVLLARQAPGADDQSRAWPAATGSTGGRGEQAAARSFGQTSRPSVGRGAIRSELRAGIESPTPLPDVRAAYIHQHAKRFVRITRGWRATRHATSESTSKSPMRIWRDAADRAADTGRPKK